VTRVVFVPLLALVLCGCSIPAWVPLLGKPLAVPNLPAPAPEPRAAAPAATRERLPESDAVMDRVICVVNDSAITLFDLDEAEGYYLYESKESPPEGAARQALRDRLLQRMVENRLQLQQAERERIIVEDAEIADQLGEVMKKVNAKTSAELEEVLTGQGLTVEGVRKRIKDQILVQKVVRRKVGLRVTVTEAEIDRYLALNRDKLETGLSFEARHILFLPRAGAGDDGWDAARRNAEEVYGMLAAGEDFGDLARKFSEDGSGKDGGHLGTIKRGELALEIEAAILKLNPGEFSAPFRSQVGLHLFKLESKESLVGEALTQARNQIREILYREKYQSRLNGWLAEIRQRAVIEIRL